MRRFRLLLLLDILAAACVGAAALVAAGMPLAVTGRLRPPALALLAALVALSVIGVGWVLLVRAVARPAERLVAAARELAVPSGAMPVLGSSEEPASLVVVAIAFERVAAALLEERARLAAKVAELERTNQALAEARESWARSERLAAVGRLGAGIAHEVGNPLGAITGYVELARSRIPPGADPELAGSLERIGAAATRIDVTIRDLLDFARPTSPALGRVEVAAVVDAVLRLARVQPRFRGVEVRVDMPPELPAVRAEFHRLSQVMLNLVLNGADAAGPGGHLEVAARVKESDSDQVAVVVADDGPGIAAEDLDRVFEPFFTTKEPGHGSGLGLAVSRALVESFGGRLEVANRPGSGAAFTVSLRSLGDEGAR